VATAFALGVLEPMMAGIGGGGSMTIWMETENRADHVEFYPVAKGDPDFALDEAMQSEDEEARAAITPERLVGVPGAVGGLLAAHEHYGTLPVETVLEPAVRLARDGFLVHTLLAGVIVEARAKLTADPEVAAIFYPDSLPYQDPEALGRVVDAIRIARADRDAWVGAPGDAAVPGAGLTSAAYAAERAALIGATVTDTLAPGDPWDEDKLPPAPSCAAIDPFPATTFPKPEVETSQNRWRGEEEYAQTTHLSVVDKDRNAVSMTYTMGLYFGSGTFSEGAFYNTAAMNFGGPEANRRGPYRSPRSSTAPSLVLQGDDIKLVVGSPASGRIPPAIVHTIIYTLDFGFDPARAVAMPRIYPAYRSRRVQLEQGFTSEALAGLRARGYDLAVQRPYDMFFGGVHAVLVRDDGWLVGAADPRRDGAAVGY
jgi:gamma-glutamyltranspeptidase